MGRKPIDQIKQSPQELVWAVVRQLNIFCVSEVVKKTSVNRKTLKDYLARLEAGRFIEKHITYEDDGRYIVLRDVGVHAPRLKRDGSPVTQGAGVLNMWRAMRMMKKFTPRDLALHANSDTVHVRESTAKSYCSLLRKAGYWRVVEKAVPGKSQVLYHFIKDTGPQAPQIQRVKQVFDPNLGKVMFYPNGACDV